jgi:hypothetical protein
MSQLKPLRVALYRRYRRRKHGRGMDAFPLRQVGIPVRRVDADEIKKGGLNAKYDAVLIADDTVRAIVGGSEARRIGVRGGRMPFRGRRCG